MEKQPLSTLVSPSLPEERARSLLRSQAGRGRAQLSPHRDEGPEAGQVGCLQFSENHWGKLFRFTGNCYLPQTGTLHFMSSWSDLGKKVMFPPFSCIYGSACRVLSFEVRWSKCLIITRGLTCFAKAALAGKSHQPLGDRWLHRADQGCGLCDLSRWVLGSEEEELAKKRTGRKMPGWQVDLFQKKRIDFTDNLITTRMKTLWLERQRLGMKPISAWDGGSRPVPRGVDSEQGGPVPV